MHLNDLLTDEEWRLAGLDRLSTSQRAIIDAALARNAMAVIAAARQEATAETANPFSSAEPIVQTAASRDDFGFDPENQDRHDQSTLTSRVTEWAGGNRFRLENGQVWEGSTTIPYQLPGRIVTIAPHRFGRFALIVDGQSTTILVRRIE